jgi:hypothetical protein
MTTSRQRCEYIGVIPGSEDLYICPFAAVWRIRFTDHVIHSCEPHAQDFLKDVPEAIASPLYPLGADDGEEGSND